MIKSLIKLAVVLIIGILIYNFFLGTPEEKQNSKAVFKEVKDVAIGIKGLVKSEKQKFKEGKYDNAVDEVSSGVKRLGDMLSTLKKDAKEIDEKYIDKIEGLEQKKRDLEKSLAEYDDSGNGKKSTGKTSGDTTKLKEDWQKLLQETDAVINEMKIEE